MSEPERPGSGTQPGLFSSLRSFWAVLIAIIYTRLDLATAELEESGLHALRLLIVSLAALLSLGLTVFFLLLLLVVVLWPWHVAILSLICVLTLIATIALSFTAYNLFKNQPKFLGQTLTELKQDAASLRAAAIKKEES